MKRLNRAQPCKKQKEKSILSRQERDSHTVIKHDCMYLYFAQFFSVAAGAYTVYISTSAFSVFVKVKNAVLPLNVFKSHWNIKSILGLDCGDSEFSKKDPKVHLRNKKKKSL